jgi:hypothetical protein
MSNAAPPRDMTAYLSSVRERIAVLRDLAQSSPLGIADKLRQIARSLEADADQLQKLEEPPPSPGAKGDLALLPPASFTWRPCPPGKRSEDHHHHHDCGGDPDAGNGVPVEWAEHRALVNRHTRLRVPPIDTA